MKQIWPNYSYSPATNVLTLTGLNIDRDQLLLVTAADRGRIMYNFADSSVTASAFTSGANTALTLVATTAGLTTTAALVIYYDDQLASTTVTVSSLPAVSGTVTANGLAVGSTVANVFPIGVDTQFSGVRTVTDLIGYRLPISLGDSSAVVSASLSDPLPAGTNRIGVVTIGAGTVTIGAGTAQIGSVTASISGTVPVSGTFFQATQPVSLTSTTVTVSSIPAIAGTVTANLTFDALTNSQGGIASNEGGVAPSLAVQLGYFDGTYKAVKPTQPLPVYPAQGTTVSNTNFTSITASTSLVAAVAGRECLTVFNEGAGNLHISPGATCTTVAYQVRLSAGDYWECPQGQLSLAHTAVFSTAGTARVCQVS